MLYNLAKQREFLFEVFYNEFLGLGIPADWAPNSYDVVMSTDATVQARTKLEHVSSYGEAATPPPQAQQAPMQAQLEVLQQQQMMASLAQMQHPQLQMAAQGQLPQVTGPALDALRMCMAGMQMGGGVAPPTGGGAQAGGAQGGGTPPIVEIEPSCAICVAMGLPNTQHRLEACGHYVKAKRSQLDSAQAAARRAKEAAAKNDAAVPK